MTFPAVPPLSLEGGISQHCAIPEIPHTIGLGFFRLILQTHPLLCSRNSFPTELFLGKNLMLFSSSEAELYVFCLNQFSQLI